MGRGRAHKMSLRLSKSSVKVVRHKSEILSVEKFRVRAGNSRFPSTSLRAGSPLRRRVRSGSCRNDTVFFLFRLRSE